MVCCPNGREHANCIHHALADSFVIDEACVLADVMAGTAWKSDLVAPAKRRVNLRGPPHIDQILQGSSSFLATLRTVLIILVALTILNGQNAIFAPLLRVSMILNRPGNERTDESDNATRD